MLGRQLYIGIVTWGARKKTDVGGRTKVRRWRPETERIRVECPRLRIISEELWQAVQARRTATARRPGWTLDPRAARPPGRDSAKCAQCGAGLTRASRPTGQRDTPAPRLVYGCGAHAGSRCANAVELPEPRSTPRSSRR